MRKSPKTKPDLRFPKFEGEWEEVRLGRYLNEFRSRSNRNNEYLVLTSSNRGLMKQEEYYGENRITERDNTGFNIIPPGFITYRSRSDNRTFTFNVNDLGITGVISTYYPVFSIRNGSNKFFVEYLNHYRHYLGRQSVGTSQQVLSLNELREIRLRVPDKAEQLKIAAFLSKIDEKLQQLLMKKELLKKYKQGVIQQIFDGNIRFRDDRGNHFPDWSEFTLNKFLVATPREIEIPSKRYLAIGIRSHFKGTFQKPNSDPAEIEMDKLYVVRAGDLIVNITFAWEGAVAIAKDEDDGGLVSHRFPTYTFNEKIAKREFFEYVYSTARFKHFLKLISPGGAGRNRVLNKKDFLALKVRLPSILEQIKIARCLRTLDLKIDCVNSQFENTRTFKRGLLQQMFV